MKKQVTFWIDEQTRKRFSQLYTYSMSKFFRNCIDLALRDKQFFYDVFSMGELRNEEEKSIEVQKSIF